MKSHDGVSTLLVVNGGTDAGHSWLKAVSASLYSAQRHYFAFLRILHDLSYHSQLDYPPTAY